MDTTKADGPSRQKSMLPQKTNVETFPKPLDHSSKQKSHDAGGKCGVLVENRALVVPQAAHNKGIAMLPPGKLRPIALMLPPATLGQNCSKSDCAKIGHVPKESTSRKLSIARSANGVYPSQDFRAVSRSRPNSRINSEGSDSQSNSEESHHGRSSSQQVKQTATSESLKSKAFSQRHSSTKNPRPAFLAMQQHYSPKKSFQADSCTLPSSESSLLTGKHEIPSADMLHLQMDLAQLHLLHRSVLSVQVQWEESARRSIGHQFSALYERHIELKEVAHQQLTLINQSSLVQWSQGRSGAQIAEKVQLLSHHVSETCNLLDSEGKYTHVLEIFNSWFAQALQVRGQRDTNGGTIRRDLDIIEGIGDGWKAEAMVLERELTYSARDFESFGDVSKS